MGYSIEQRSVRAGANAEPTSAIGASALVCRESAADPYRPRRRGGEYAPDPVTAETSKRADCVTAETSTSGDPDILDALGDEIAILFAHVHAAEHRLLVLIAEFDRLRGWERAGYSDCARWLAARTGIGMEGARERVRTARALEQLPQISASMARGEVSLTKARALTRIATAEDEADLLELARGATGDQTERLVRAWRLGSRHDEEAWEQERHRSRTLSIRPDSTGMYEVRGKLMPEVGAMLMRAIDAAGDALFKERWIPRVSEAGSQAEASAQLRADAIGLLAERAMAAGFVTRGCGGFGTGADDAVEVHEGEPSGRRACGCGSSDVPISGTRAERYQVVLHVDEGTVSETGDPIHSELEDGTRVSAETSRRLSCDASLIRVRANGEVVLDVGRKTRTISPALRRALEVRDRGCRFPHCGLRFTDAHHVIHWGDGGETSLANCVLLCRHHHRLVHEGGWRVGWWGAGKPVFYDPKGGTWFDGGWKTPALPEHPVRTMILENKRRGADPNEWSPASRWEREADIPDDVMLRASRHM
jgi:hypothetical protein